MALSCPFTYIMQQKNKPCPLRPQISRTRQARRIQSFVGTATVFQGPGQTLATSAQDGPSKHPHHTPHAYSPDSGTTCLEDRGGSAQAGSVASCRGKGKAQHPGAREPCQQSAPAMVPRSPFYTATWRRTSSFHRIPPEQQEKDIVSLVPRLKSLSLAISYPPRWECVAE